MTPPARRSAAPRPAPTPWLAACTLLATALGCSSPPLAPPPEQLGADRALEDSVAGRDANRRALAWILSRARAQALTAAAQPRGD